MLVQPIKDEGATSERPSEAQPIPSPPHPSEANVEPQSDPYPRPLPSTHIPDSIPESSDQAKEIQHLKAQITKLKKQAKPVIKYHRAWLKSVSLKQRFPRKSFSKKHRVRKESVSKQGRKFAKVDHMETENAQDEGRTRKIVDENKEIDENILSTEDVLSTDKEGVSTDRQNENTEENFKGTEEHNEGTEEQIESTDGQRKSTEDHSEEGNATQATQTPTSIIFGDD
ncbi:hypothetical protein Tco_0130182, partial [Tanacetum coccineum]